MNRTDIRANLAHRLGIMDQLPEISDEDLLHRFGRLVDGGITTRLLGADVLPKLEALGLVVGALADGVRPVSWDLGGGGPRGRHPGRVLLGGGRRQRRTCYALRLPRLRGAAAGRAAAGAAAPPACAAGTAGGGGAAVRRRDPWAILNRCSPEQFRLFMDHARRRAAALERAIDEAIERDIRGPDKEDP